MSPRRRSATVLFALLALTFLSSAQAADGVVVNEKNEPIAGADVCYFVDNIEVLCNQTDAKGRYELPVAETDTIRAHAEGYNPRVFSSAGQHGPVVLIRAPSLMVRLIDRAGGQGVENGEVMINYPSGKEFGPFPVNKAGLRIQRGLKPGEVRIVGRADGYRSADPVSVKLTGGEESRVVIELVALETKKPD